jgi:glycosyltransferase involved in cell wall biosynthesis
VSRLSILALTENIRLVRKSVNLITLSVIVPTRNRSHFLRNALESICFQQGISKKSFEVIVIDNGSSDDTKQVVESFKETISNLRYVYEDKPGLHVGRHIGCQLAKGDILVYIDDDIEAFPKWLSNIQSCFADKNVDMVGGNILPKFESHPPEWLSCLWEERKDGVQKMHYLSIINLGDEAKEIFPGDIYGCNYSIRKSILYEAGGFHPDAMPEQLIKYRGDGESPVSLYVHSKGYKVMFHPEASVYHFVPNNRMKVKYFLNRAFRDGISQSYTEIRNNGMVSIKSEGFSRSKEKISNLKSQVKDDIMTWLMRKKCKSERIKKRICSSHMQGYKFHREQVAKDNGLLEWVLRKDYWDYNLPKGFEE